MALKKPLVVGADGRPQQLQSGDSIDAVETGQITLVATATLIAGNAVYADGAGSVDKARANATGTSLCRGLAKEAITAAASGTIQTNGALSLTTGEWDAVAGTTGGLTAGTTYYVSPCTAGLLTATCPTSVGQLVIIVGVALSTTVLDLKIQEPILL